jgi:hypothetical protein
LLLCIFFSAFGLLKIVNFLLDLFDGRAFYCRCLLFALHVFPVLGTHVVLFEFDFIKGVPNIVSLDNGQANVIADLLAITNTEVFRGWLQFSLIKSF